MKVTLIAGDGIGPEITQATVEVLISTGVDLEFDLALAGAVAQRETGQLLPVETTASLRRNRIGLKGPLIVEKGSPPVTIASGERFATPNAALRGVSNAFAKVRPSRLFPGVPSRYEGLPIDLVIVREVSEGIYLGLERQVSDTRAEATLITTQQASERVIRFAFELARKQGRSRVTAIHKANVLDKTDGLFLRTFQAIAPEWPELESDDLMVDAAAAALVRAPESFDVIVAPNQYGDILSDLAAEIAGGLGLGAGSNYGDEIALFEPCHGAAPDIAGRGIANPIALILSGAMLLEHVGEQRAANRVREAVAGFLLAGVHLTPDLGGTGTTSSVAERVAERVLQCAK